MPIVFAAPASNPDVPGGAVNLLPRRMTWTGADGSVWPLTRPQAVNPRLRPGVKGLHMPAFEVQASATPLVHGEELLGYSIPARSVYWPLLFRAASVDDWADQHGRFFDSFHPVNVGRWTVGQDDDARTLDLAGSFTGDYTFQKDPFLHGWAIIGVELTAPRPLWRGKTIRQEFDSAEGEPFIGSAKAPPFYISGSATYQTATVDNPGNEPAYLRWEIAGPAEDIQLGVGTALIDVPFPVADGATLIIDTDPVAQYATLDGVDVTRELGFQMFAPVPAKGTTPLVISATGGTVAVELDPLYWRAF